MAKPNPRTADNLLRFNKVQKRSSMKSTIMDCELVVYQKSDKHSNTESHKTSSYLSRKKGPKNFTTDQWETTLIPTSLQSFEILVL